MLNTYAKPVVAVLRPVMPFVAMICTSLCIGSPLAINRAQILSREGFRLVFPVLAFHAVAFTLGYWVSKIPVLRYISHRHKIIILKVEQPTSNLISVLVLDKFRLIIVHFTGKRKKLAEQSHYAQECKAQPWPDCLRPSSSEAASQFLQLVQWLPWPLWAFVLPLSGAVAIESETYQTY